MKKVFSVVFFGWLSVALAVAIYNIAMAFDLVWIGVVLVALPPILNNVWPYDRVGSTNAKVQSPKVSFVVMLGMAWVLLTLSERGWPLWFALGGLGGFLLYTYWVKVKVAE